MRFGCTTSAIFALLTSLAAVGVASPTLQDRVASFQGANAEHDAASKYFHIRSPSSVEDGEEGISDDSAGNSALEEFKRSPSSAEGNEEVLSDDSAGNSPLREFKG